jgi:cytochrome c biogenesis protein CcdA
LFERAYDSGDGLILHTGRVYEDDLEKDADELTLPFFGAIRTDHSLPVLTLLLGVADGFNPCAFFILTFLLATMLYAASEQMSKAEKRRRILLVGIIFVLISALIYFLFIGLWLNVFHFFDTNIWLTLIAGAVAIFAGVINVKDYFFFQRGFSCTLPKTEKLKFTDRVDRLKFVRSWQGLLVGTIIVAITVNLYELLCTIGLPIVYLRILTLHELSYWVYYSYIAAYCVIYVIPLIVIVLLFAYTLGGSEFSVHNVKRLKLASGVMILFLGLALIFSPRVLIDPAIAIGLVLAAVLCALLIMLVYERVLQRTI